MNAGTPIVMVVPPDKGACLPIIGQARQMLRWNDKFVLEIVSFGTAECYSSLGSELMENLREEDLPRFFCGGDLVASSLKELARYIANKEAALAGHLSGELTLNDAEVVMSRYAGRKPDGAVRAGFDSNGFIRTVSDRNGEVTLFEEIPVAVPVNLDDFMGKRVEIVYKEDDVTKESEYPQMEPDENGKLLKVVIYDLRLFLRHLARMQSMAAYMDINGGLVSKVSQIAPLGIGVEPFDENWRQGLDTLRVYADDAYMEVEGKWDPTDRYEVKLPSVEKIKELARKQNKLNK